MIKVAVLPGASDNPSDSDGNTNRSYSGTDDGENGSVQHTLTFECTGVPNESSRQGLLKVAAMKLSKEQLPEKVKG